MPLEDRKTKRRNASNSLAVPGRRAAPGKRSRAQTRYAGQAPAAAATRKPLFPAQGAHADTNATSASGFEVKLSPEPVTFNYGITGSIEAVASIEDQKTELAGFDRSKLQLNLDKWRASGEGGLVFSVEGIKVNPDALRVDIAGYSPMALGFEFFSTKADAFGNQSLNISALKAKLTLLPIKLAKLGEFDATIKLNIVLNVPLSAVPQLAAQFLEHLAKKYALELADAAVETTESLEKLTKLEIEYAKLEAEKDRVRKRKKRSFRQANKKGSKVKKRQRLTRRAQGVADELNELEKKLASLKRELDDEAKRFSKASRRYRKAQKKLGKLAEQTLSAAKKAKTAARKIVTKAAKKVLPKLLASIALRGGAKFIPVAGWLLAAYDLYELYNAWSAYSEGLVEFRFLAGNDWQNVENKQSGGGDDRNGDQPEQEGAPLTRTKENDSPPSGSKNGKGPQPRADGPIKSKSGSSNENQESQPDDSSRELIEKVFRNGLPLVGRQREELEAIIAAKLTPAKLAVIGLYPGLLVAPVDPAAGLKQLDQFLNKSPADIERFAVEQRAARRQRNSYKNDRMLSIGDPNAKNRYRNSTAPSFRFESRAQFSSLLAILKSAEGRGTLIEELARFKIWEKETFWAAEAALFFGVEEGQILGDAEGQGAKNGDGDRDGDGNGNGNGNGNGLDGTMGGPVKQLSTAGRENSKVGNEGTSNGERQERVARVVDGKRYSGKTGNKYVGGGWLTVARSELKQRPLFLYWQLITGVLLRVRIDRVLRIDYKEKLLLVNFRSALVFRASETGLEADVYLEPGKSTFRFK